uniref:Uncharacterized protein n=1 Tax=Oryza brachyantha TaxID=4533 RepID=J3L6V0_ORYBR
MPGPPRTKVPQLKHRENVVTRAGAFIQMQNMQNVLGCRQKAWQTGNPIQFAHRDQISLRHRGGTDAGSAALERHLGGGGNCQQCGVQACMCPPCVRLHWVLWLYDRLHDHSTTEVGDAKRTACE